MNSPLSSDSSLEAPPALPRGVRTRTVLVVDDSSTSRQVAVECLRSVFSEVLQARDGAEALDLLDGRPVHLVVCDLVMPRMDGLSMAEEVRRRDTYRHVPILMLTSVAVDSFRERARGVGIRAWLPKPLQAQSLLDAVAKLVGT